MRAISTPEASMLIVRKTARQAAALVTIALAFAACTTSHPPIHPQVTPTDIVRRNALDALETFFTKADVSSLQAFRARISTAGTRQDLIHAWAEVPGLLAKGADFLTKHVFDKAMAEDRWPKTSPPGDFEPAFVSGVQEAVDAFLKEAQ